ncbi:hypothetical protein SEMRO_2303_G322560.1 [Seminavis robusta]|uniref:Uncharacterized protein n=1 Tax=Seminavis robusta TaxID=568900 RepID=A0A9N8EX46_9STRA|nr:hypothetical protein SEMRO_2303_G322560.1 [Seminavis robusta]|eukprot:Sro2303_g322560.1 n/a (177) ;mRNA; f:7557-8087
MANNANDGAFGWEDVPDLPEAPTEQPSTTGITISLRQIHGWLHKRTSPRRLASTLVLWPASNNTTLPTIEMACVWYDELTQRPRAESNLPLLYFEQDKKAISFYMPIKGATWNGTLRQSNQVRPVNEVVKEVKKAETQHRARSPVPPGFDGNRYRKVVHNSTAKGALNRPSVQPAG